MAAGVLRFRNAALARRARVVRASPLRGVQRPLPPRLLAAAGTPGNTGVLVAEGDSWFDYPMHDVLRMLEDEHGFDIQSVAHKGDHLEGMAYNAGQLEEFTRAIEKLLRQGRVPAAILLSGGGNDIAGEQFGMLVNHVKSARAGLSGAVVRGVIDERIRDAYVFILSAVTAVSRARTGRAIPIVLHGYDRPVPDGRGVLGGCGPLPGPWLEPGFRDKGFDDLDRTTRLVGTLIDRFNAMLRRVAALPGFEHVHYLDLRGTLSSGRDYKAWWANELHPTGRGFSAVADAFAALIVRLQLTGAPRPAPSRG